MTYTSKQQQFYDAAMSGGNIFLTGKAGTGKSFIVSEVLNAMRKAGRKVAAIAPTGIAANNIDGQTIHSMFKLQPFGVLDFETCNYLKGSSREVLQKVDTLVIDEVSMLRPDILDAMHYTLRKNGLDGLSDRQVIFVGDLKQLPPIVDDNTRAILYRTYDGDTLQFAKIYPKIAPTVIELDEVVRQSDDQFIHHLNIIREGGRSEYFRQFISDNPSGIVLAPHNATVARYNEAGLRDQPGEEMTFTATITGTAKPEDFQFEQEIRVKNGCKIMYLVNSKDNPLRNGTLGVFVSHRDCHYIRVGNIDYPLEQIEVTKKQYVYDKETDELQLREVGSITQYPFRLAYALSIHKSQGLTFDEVTVDLKQPCFMSGQMYVALSRVKTPAGLRIII